MNIRHQPMTWEQYMKMIEKNHEKYPDTFMNKKQYLAYRRKFLQENPI